ncbi:hypothetical protein D3C78_537350 [compost metagenome]
MRVLEGAGVAQVVEQHRLAGEARVELLQALAVELAVQAGGGEGGEVAKARGQQAAQAGAAVLRQDQRADQPRAEDAQADLQHPPQRLHEGAFGVGDGRQADQRRGVAGQHAAVAAKVAVARRAGGAQADPQRQAEQEQHPLLGEQGEQRDHHRQPQQGAEDAVEALGQHLAAFRLHDDEHRGQHRARLRQFQAVGQPQGEQGTEQGLEDERPDQPLALHPLVEAAPEGAGQRGRRVHGAAHGRPGGCRRTARACNWSSAGALPASSTPPPRATHSSA